MIITDELLKDVEEMASLFFTIREISVKTGIDLTQLKTEIRKENTQLNLAYNKGKLNSEMEIRRQIIRSAKMGSPAAQEEAGKLWLKQRIFEKLN